MNGFANTVFSVLLGWLRGLLNSGWNLLGSDVGSAFLNFMRRNWLTIAIALCLAGLVVDIVVYLLRWRPYYVWSTRLSRLRRRLSRKKTEEYAEAFSPAGPVREPAAEDDEFEYYQEPARAQYIETPYAAGGDTLVSRKPTPYAYQPRYGQPMASDPALGLARGFGAAQPEPESYLMDVQAGYAPPPAPEALYKRPSQQTFSEPIHPGLDIDTFQQNIGLTGSPQEQPPREYDDYYEPEAVEERETAAFEPAFFKSYQDNGQPRARRALSSLAKKARTLVSPPSDDDKLSIHDLQPTVDIKSAFHAPVLPQRPPSGYEE